MFVCQRKPTNVNILPYKSVLTDHICHINSSILSQQLFFIFFLSVYYNFSIITMNIFTNMHLATVILLSKLLRLSEIFMFILRNSTFLRFSLNTYTTFQSCQTMLLLKLSEVSFFTNSVCVSNNFATIFQHLTSKQTVLKVFYKNFENF